MFKKVLLGNNSQQHKIMVGKRAMVAYGAGRVVRRRAAYMVPPRYRMAMRAASFAYSHRGSIRRAGRLAGKGYRSFKRKQLAKVGHVVGTSTGKKCDVSVQSSNGRDTRVLFSNSLTENIVKGSNIDQRERDTINLRGFKMYFEFTNRFNQPLYCHVAVLVPKNGSTVSTQDFFRAHTTSRAEDFNQGRDSIEMREFPINTDKNIILMHHRFKLNPKTGDVGQAFNTDGPPNWYKFNRWLTVKRQVRYDGQSNTDNLSNAFLVYWADRFSQAPGSTGVANHFNMAHRITAYFKEPGAF